MPGVTTYATQDLEPKKSTAPQPYNLNNERRKTKRKEISRGKSCHTWHLLRRNNNNSTNRILGRYLYRSEYKPSHTKPHLSYSMVLESSTKWWGRGINIYSIGRLSPQK